MSEKYYKGIKVCCENCSPDAKRYCANWNPHGQLEGTDQCINEYFEASNKALNARLDELTAFVRKVAKAKLYDYAYHWISEEVDVDDVVYEARALLRGESEEK